MAIDVNKIREIAKRAGDEILDVYNAGPVEVELKSDNSPLTVADKRANRVITDMLRSATPNIPVLSEEGRDIPWDERRNWQRFWLVDPLDGTKEFIKRNGEFTVNIALIENGRPVLGVIYVPVTDTLYAADAEYGAVKSVNGGEPRAISVNTDVSDGLIIVRSRSHPSAEEDAFYRNVHVRSEIARGSSLKFCMIAEGLAHLYYRHGPTMEWDTAAGHAIAEIAGARVTNPNGTDFVYNKPVLKNGPFIASVIKL